VAHELRSPLGAAQLALHRLSTTMGANPDPATAVVVEELNRLKRMADEFAEFGRLPEGPESDIDLSELVESVLAATVPAACPVDRTVEPGLTLRGRYEPLRRALQNVVRNAVEATDRRGIAVRARRNDAAIICVVEDHGPGIPAALRPRIFEPYVTSKPTGTGLGLAIVHRAVQAHGGSLTVETGPDGGAAFTFTLPVPLHHPPPEA
jgi:signal transduction histidine kinase